MTSQPEEVSRSKGNQTIKFGNLIEYRKCGGETIPRPYSKKSKLKISLDQWSKVLYSLFLLYAKLTAVEMY